MIIVIRIVVIGRWGRGRILAHFTFGEKGRCQGAEERAEELHGD